MILVVDDDHHSSRALLRLLKMHGFDASAAECANNALHMMRRQEPSMVLLDCHMPDFDGFMMLKVLKTEPGLADVPVVMFSAGDEADEARSLSLGARAFVRKGTHGWPRILEVVKRFAGNGSCACGTR